MICSYGEISKNHSLFFQKKKKNGYNLTHHNLISKGNSYKNNDLTTTSHIFGVAEELWCYNSVGIGTRILQTSEKRIFPSRDTDWYMYANFCARNNNNTYFRLLVKTFHF